MDQTRRWSSSRPAGRHGLRRGPELRSSCWWCRTSPGLRRGHGHGGDGFFRKVGSVLGTSVVARCSRAASRAPWPSASRRSAASGRARHGRELAHAGHRARPGRAPCGGRRLQRRARARALARVAAGRGGPRAHAVLRETRLATTVDGSGHGPTKARTPAAAGRATPPAARPRGRQPTLTGQGCGCLCGLGAYYFMSELF